MMGMITIFAIFLTAAFLAVYWKEDFCDTFPMTVSAGILVLYGLAFVKWLPYADFFIILPAVGVVLWSVFPIMRQKITGGNPLKKQPTHLTVQEERIDLLKQALHMVFSARSLLFLAVCVIITWLVKDKAALWWDDINYWAVDAKALYYNGGFAGKYGNVAPEFGDYPPALQLFKWFFLHFSKEGFKEGLMFAAYHCLNLIYMLPLLKKIPKNKPGFFIAGILGIFLIPGIVDGIAKEGTCADVTMGIVYGAFLWGVADYKGHSKYFYFVRLALYLAVLILTKSVGIEWAFFGLVFFVLFWFYQAKEKRVSVKSVWQVTAGLAAVGLFAEGSWLLFCLLNRRVAKLTGAGIRLAVSGDFSFLRNAAEKSRFFAQGFFTQPMHGENGWGIDLSAAALLAVFVGLVFVYRRMKLLKKQETGRFLFFILFTAMMSYGIIFLGHITIFAQEVQYHDAYVMAKSISRYGAPFTLGLLYLFMGILIWQKGIKGYAFCLLFVVLTTSFSGAYQTLWGYRSTVEESVRQRDDMTGKEVDIFRENLRQAKENSGQKDLFQTRVLYLRDDNTIHWVKDTYISYEVSPVPVVYGGIKEDMTKEALLQIIQNSHAAYLYADQVNGDISHLFEGMTEEFLPETFYEIKEENGSLRLVPLL